jgi:hypothetical protein
MDQVQIQWLKDGSGHIAQIYSSGLEFCFVSDDMRQCHAFVYCKDFLQDVVHGFIHKKRASIYGFSYDPSTQPPLCMNMCRIALTNSSDKDFREKIPNVVDFVNQVAKKLHLKRTQAFEAIDPPKKYKKCGVFLLDGSSRWMNSPPMVSMYSLFVRCGFSHTKGKDFMETIDGIISGKIPPYQRNDRSQLTGAIKGINNILKVGYRKFFYIDNEKNYPKNTSVDILHNSGGIQAFSSGSNVVPYWHRKSLKKVLEEKK